MYKYIIQGAGAVGSAIGGSLAKAGFAVTLVSRKPHVEAIKSQNGLFLHTLSGIELQPIEATENISALTMSDDTIIFQTMKANDTEASLDDLKEVDKNIPIICFQNGVDNESIINTMFNRVYGGATRFTATMMKPGETQFAGTGKIILGPYPEGMDAMAEQIVRDLSQTGFTCMTSTNIMQDKWLKLLVNLISCIKPMTRKTGDEQALRVTICRHVMVEGIAVLDKAGITAESTNGTEDSADKMLYKFDDALALAEGVGQGMPLLNSTWQSLAKHKKVLENDWYTGKIITLGEKFGVPTPYNRAIFYYLYEIAKNEMGPESVDVEKIIEKASEL
jgi:2-dehydropantoate 2-reductase